MKKYLLGLFVSVIAIALSGNAFAKPSFGNNCGSCHGVPVVTSFDLPASHNALTVPITGYTATDTDPQKSSLSGVSGYMITTSSSVPDAGASGWQSSPPSAYTFAADGLQTLYAWAKDSLGIVSAAVSDVVSISIVTNVAPVADAGPDQTVAEGVSVTLNGANSGDSDGGIDTYLWEQTAGPVTVEIVNPMAEQPTFNTPDVGPGGVALTFRLTVTDLSGATDTDTTIVNVSWVNIQPVANAGADQTVAEGTPVTLDGSGSNGVDDGIATYSWSQVNINGVTAVLSDPNVPNPQFTITDAGPNGGSLTFELTVTDDGGLLATDRVVVNVTNSNQVPVADAGADQTVAAGAEVVLDGSGSYDPENDLNPDNAYIWRQTAGTSVTLSAPGAIYPAFTAPGVAAGESETLVFELTVTDSGLLQATDTCEIRVNGATLPPVVDPPVVDPPVVDPPVVDPPVVDPPVVDPPVVDPPAVDPPVVDPPAVDPPVVDPPVVDPPVVEPPVASAGSDQVVTEGQTVFLNGAGSTDNLGIFTYAWLQLAGPGGAVIAADDPDAVVISDPFDVQISFVTPAVGVNGAILTFELTVTDGDGAQDSAEVRITVEDNGIVDFDDMPDVISTYSTDGQPIGIGNTGANACTRFVPLEDQDVPRGVQQPRDAPYGFVDFELKVDDPANTSVTIYLPSPAPAGYKWYKYTDARGWFDFSRHLIGDGTGDGAVFNADRTQVTVYITDDSEFDDDPTPNIIRDPGGLASGLSSPASAGSGNGACFIGASIDDAGLPHGSRTIAAVLFVCFAAAGYLLFGLRRRTMV
jgi:K319L-like, PKD domain